MFAENSAVWENVRPGMSIDAFEKAFAGAAAGIQGSGFRSDGQVSKTGTLYGLSGDWTWDFKEGRLDWYMWNVYLEDISQDNFDVCLKAARRIIEECTGKLGKPAAAETGSQQFRDPYTDHHWGYPVLSAEWITPEMKLRAAFKFMGSKGEYYFLVSVEVHGPDYDF